MSVGVAQNLCSSLRTACGLRCLGRGNQELFPPTRNSLANICVRGVQPVAETVSPNCFFLIVSVSDSQLLLVVGFCMHDISF